MIQIKPVKLPFGGKKATTILIKIEFVLNSDSSYASYSINNEDGENVISSQIPIPTETHMAWGTDDTVIEDYVLKQLNIERL